MTAITWQGIALDDIAGGAVEVLEVVRPMGPAPRDVRLDVPGRAGSWLYVEEPGDVELVARFAYVGTDFADRRTVIGNLAAWLYAPDAAARIIVDDEPDRFWRGRVAEAPTPRELLLLAEFDVRWIVEPFAMSTTVSHLSTTSSTAGSFGPATFTGGGHVKTPPSIQISASSAGISGGFVLAVNGTELVYSADLGPLESVTVSTVTGLVVAGAGVDTELTGAVDLNALDMRLVSGDFGDIVAGDNTVTVTPADSSVGNTITIDYRRRFLA